MKSVMKLIPVVALVLLTGCDNMSPREQTILSGSAIGAIGGAAIGGIAGGSSGAAFGALVGAGAGAVGGAMVDDRNAGEAY